MSNHWNIRCLACGADCCFGQHYLTNHGDGLMSKLIEYRAAIAAVADLVDNAAVDVGVQLSIGSSLSVDVRWFRDHAGHPLSPADEYGGLLGQCDEWGTCARCGEAAYCELRDDHVGVGHEFACREHATSTRHLPDGRRAAPEVTAGAVVRVTRSPDMDESTCPHNFAIDPETDTCLTCGARL